MTRRLSHSKKNLESKKKQQECCSLLARVWQNFICSAAGGEKKEFQAENFPSSGWILLGNVCFTGLQVWPELACWSCIREGTSHTGAPWSLLGLRGEEEKPGWANGVQSGEESRRRPWCGFVKLQKSTTEFQRSFWETDERKAYWRPLEEPGIPNSQLNSPEVLKRFGMSANKAAPCVKKVHNMHLTRQSGSWIVIRLLQICQFWDFQCFKKMHVGFFLDQRTLKWKLLLFRRAPAAFQANKL